MLPIKDKLAIVFNGIVGGDTDRNGFGNPIDYKSCAKTISHNIIDVNDCDVFIHSWSVTQSGDLIRIYKPKKHLFEPQNAFSYNLTSQERVHPEKGQAFRTTSHYVSIKRGIQLKCQYEQEQGFRYKWVLIFRFDYIVLKKLDLNGLDNSNMYICYEPHWPNIDKIHKLYDGLFLGGPDVMEFFYRFGDEILQPGCSSLAGDCHTLVYDKLVAFLGNPQRIKYVYERFKDIEIWRFINNPNLNPLGVQYGVLDTKTRSEKLLKELNNG